AERAEAATPRAAPAKAHWQPVSQPASEQSLSLSEQPLTTVRTLLQLATVCMITVCRHPHRPVAWTQSRLSRGGYTALTASSTSVSYLTSSSLSSSSSSSLSHRCCCCYCCYQIAPPP